MKSTMWPTVWKKWAEAKGFSPNILSHEVKKFDRNLRRLLTEKEGKFRAMSHTEFAGIGNIPGRSFNFGVFPQIPLVTMLFPIKTLELDIRD